MQFLPWRMKPKDLRKENVHHLPDKWFGVSLLYLGTLTNRMSLSAQNSDCIKALKWNKWSNFQRLSLESSVPHSSRTLPNHMNDVTLTIGSTWPKTAPAFNLGLVAWKARAPSCPSQQLQQVGVALLLKIRWTVRLLCSLILVVKLPFKELKAPLLTGLLSSLSISLTPASWTVWRIQCFYISFVLWGTKTRNTKWFFLE